MKHKLNWLLIAIVSCVSTFAACGSDDEGTDNSDKMVGTWIVADYELELVCNDAAAEQRIRTVMGYRSELDAIYHFKTNKTYSLEPHASDPVTSPHSGDFTLYGDKLTLYRNKEAVQTKVSYPGNDMLWTSDETNLLSSTVFLHGIGVPNFNDVVVSKGIIRRVIRKHAE